jgi:uncharacterized membrane-anchored protein YhcB (DUF1043 family)
VEPSAHVIIGVLVVCYGVWLRHVVKQQLKIKDSTIENRNAQISRLQGEAAPAIAQNYQTMKKYAEETSNEVNRLAEELETVTLKLLSKEQAAPNWRMLGEAQGLVLATRLLWQEPMVGLFKSIFTPNSRLPEPGELVARLVRGTLEAQMVIKSEIETREEKLQAAGVSEQLVKGIRSDPTLLQTENTGS